MEIKKILSIDFDYIMAPCIKLYNDLCSGDENPTIIWKHIENMRKVEPYIQYDATSLMKIAKLIKANVKNKAKLIRITEHQEILLHLPLDNEDVKFQIANIDFHHDVIYDRSPEALADITDFNKYNCGNWVYYLHCHNKLDSCTWVKAPQSDLLSPDVDFKFDSILGRSDIEASRLGDDFDAVFFCLSPQWVPFKFLHLYDLIIELCKEEDNERLICSK